LKRKAEGILLEYRRKTMRPPTYFVLIPIDIVDMPKTMPVNFITVWALHINPPFVPTQHIGKWNALDPRHFELGMIDPETE